MIGIFDTVVAQKMVRIVDNLEGCGWIEITAVAFIHDKIVIVFITADSIILFSINYRRSVFIGMTDTFHNGNIFVKHMIRIRKDLKLIHVVEI